MTDSPYVIRNYQPADFDNYVLLSQEAEKLEPIGRYVLPQAIAKNLTRPNYSPEQDLFLVEIYGSVIGFMDIRSELGIGRIILDCWLHPKHRKKGLATRLLEYAIRRARELRGRVIQVNITEDNATARTVLTKLGFHCIRRFIELKLDMSRLNFKETNQAVQECYRLQRGDEHKLTQIQNRSFAAHWGYNPNTIETTTHRMNLGYCSPEDIMLTYDGDKVIGYCWTETTGDREGRIYMLGTDPDYRGKGIGKKLLLAGLAHLSTKGVGVTTLTVDSENTPACALYDSVGFEFYKGILWYEKAVNQTTGVI